MLDDRPNVVRKGFRVTEASQVASFSATEVPLNRKMLPIVEFAMIGIAVVAPIVMQDFITVYATRVLILCLFALSFDLVWGYAGIMSLGQSLFFGLGGYGIALLSRDWNVASILVVLPVGALIGLVAALMIGGFLLVGRHPSSMIFVSLGTMTGAYAADRLVRGWYYVGGQNGIPSIQSMRIGPYELVEGPTFYYLVLAILVAVYLVCRWLVRSQFGLVLAGLRENEERIAYFGYNVEHIKLIVFTLGGAIAGLAGSLYAFHESFVWSGMLGVVMATQVVLYVMLGGSGTLIGALAGTVVIEALNFWLSNTYQEIWPIILGVMLLLIVMFRPGGLVSFILDGHERVGSFGYMGRGDGRGST